MINKLIIGLVIIASVGCDKTPTSPAVNVSDTVSYRAIGNGTIGNILIDYVTPTSGVISVSSNLATPFVSGSIAGYNQFVTVRPAITIAILSTGCVEAQILINAEVVRKLSQCGPITFSVKY